VTWAIVAALGVVLVWPVGSVRRRLVSSMSTGPATRLEVASLRRRVVALAVTRPRRIAVAAVVIGGLLGGLAGGPVAGLVGAVYGGLGGRGAVRVVAKRHDAIARARTLDELCALAADLRAGLPAAPLLGVGAGSNAAAALAAGSDETSKERVVGSVSRSAVRAERRIAERVAAVWRLAEQTGAPAAELVGRIEADVRAADRGAASAAAEAAGAQATGLLLAALPVAGIAIGYAIGADPLAVLLRTPVGAACAVAALVLQCAGVLWSERLVNGPAR
jgi:tight adherence protein B